MDKDTLLNQQNQLDNDDNIPFDDYDDEYEDDDDDYILKNPQKIYEFLKTKIYNQDEACKAAAIILYNHIHLKSGNSSRNIFCGPPGSGKTYIWQVIREHLYPFVIIYNAANISKTGWTGSNKVISPLYQIGPDAKHRYIIVYDEFDKLCTPQFTSHNENVSANIQSEFLALIQPSSDYIRLKTPEGENIISIINITWVFAGSFAAAANHEADKKKTSGLGFGAVRTEAKAFDEALTLQNIIDFGVIPELASRMTRIVNLRPLSAKDFEYLVIKHQNSPIYRLEKLYGLESGFIRKNIIKPKELQEIASDAFNSGLGVRSTTSAIQRRVDDYIFKHFNEIAI